MIAKYEDVNASHTPKVVICLLCVAFVDKEDFVKVRAGRTKFVLSF